MVIGEVGNEVWVWEVRDGFKSILFSTIESAQQEVAEADKRSGFQARLLRRRIWE